MSCNLNVSSPSLSTISLSLVDKKNTNPSLNTKKDISETPESKDTKDKALDIAATTIAALTAQTLNLAVQNATLNNALRSLIASQQYPQVPPIA